MDLYCQQCGKVMDLYCQQCGKVMDLYCQQCGKVMDLYCQQCGKVMGLYSRLMSLFSQPCTFGISIHILPHTHPCLEGWCSMYSTYSRIHIHAFKDGALCTAHTFRIHTHAFKDGALCTAHTPAYTPMPSKMVLYVQHILPHTHPCLQGWCSMYITYSRIHTHAFKDGSLCTAHTPAYTPMPSRMVLYVQHILPHAHPCLQGWCSMYSTYSRIHTHAFKDGDLCTAHTPAYTSMPSRMVLSMYSTYSRIHIHAFENGALMFSS